MTRSIPRIALAVVAACAAAVAGIGAARSIGDDGESRAQPAAVLDPGGHAGPVPRRPNVVLLIMDEFPGDSLLGPDGRIDATRYPNFAALAGNATWFPNAFTRYDATPKAVPLIMDGRRPFKGEDADHGDHPRSIFDMFGLRGYSIHDSEEATAICPRRWCRHARKHRPGILAHLNRGRPERLERFFATIRRGRRPGFWLKHVLLPHEPYLYLPSGAHARSIAKDVVPGMNGVQGFHDRFLTQHSFQRYLLQVGFVDHELGKLLQRLVRLRMYDSTMIVLVADHGKAFEVGVDDRRRVNQENVDEIGPVPLFIKAPGQRRGRIDRSYVSTLDVTPTVADILNFRLPYRADGRSAFSRAVRRRRVVSLPTRDFSRTVRIGARRYEARRREDVRDRLALFGSGPWARLYTGIGPYRSLIGKPIGGVRRGSASTLRGRLLGAGELGAVHRASGLVPAQIVGDVGGGRRGAKRDVAVAVNGVFRAVGRTWYLRGSRTEHFAMNVPEESLREGRNDVEVFQVDRGGVLHLLART
ncbi:MAG: sulfatase-like hydrolase/transferase [Thermoleophilaceae bacterium]